MVSAAELAKALRAWQSDHPVADVAIGLVPGVGQVYGAASTAAAYADPDATALDRGLATAGMLPFGKAAGAVRKIAVGKKGMERLGDAADLIRGKWKGGDGNIRQELDDSAAKLNEEWFRKATTGAPVVTLEQVLDLPALYRAYPEMRNMSVKSKPGRGGDFTRFGSDSGEIRLGEDLNPQELMRVLKHEVGHGVQQLEGYKPGYTGTHSAGNPRYPRDYGEQEARVDQYRDQWPRALREEIPFYEHQRAEKWRLNMAKERGNPELAAKDMRMMEDPAVVRLILDRLRATK